MKTLNCRRGLSSWTTQSLVSLLITFKIFQVTNMFHVVDAHLLETVETLVKSDDELLSSPE